MIKRTEYTQSGNGHLCPAWLKWGGGRPFPFTISTKVQSLSVYAPAERADTLPLFLLYPYMYSVISRHYPNKNQQQIQRFLSVEYSNGKTSLVHYRTLSFFAFRFKKKRKFAFFHGFKYKITIEPVCFASIGLLSFKIDQFASLR